MGAGRFYGEDARRRVKTAVEAIEATSGAEVVVAVRARSWRYRHTHFLVGFVFALSLLAALLFLPQSFDIDFWPLELTLAFVTGAAVCMAVPGLERWLTAKSLMAEQVARAAKEAFVDLGVSKTRARTGLLIYVSLAERAAYVVPDVGLDGVGQETSFEKAAAAIERAVARADFDGLIAALEKLSAPLAKIAPRTADDINELPDEVA